MSTPAPAQGRDPLAPLLELDGVAEAAARATDAIAAVHRHRVNLRKWNLTGAESVLRGARSSAWLEGADPALPDDGVVSDPVLAAALRVADRIAPEAIGETSRTFRRAPLQVLARWAVLADPAGSAEHPDALGRPVGDDRLTAEQKERRLHGLGGLIAGGTSVPAAILSGVVHGELQTLAPFAAGNGIVARAASRLVCVTGGADPRGLAVPEVHWTRHRKAYADAAEGFRSGSRDGLREWLLLHLGGLEAGAVEARGIAEAV
ncbi:hypothetical protein [Corynebacterium sp. 335C]